MPNTEPSNARAFYNKINNIHSNPTDIRLGIKESTSLNDPIDAILQDINDSNIEFVESGYITTPDANKILYKSIQNNPLQGALEESGISELFFSDKNVNTIIQTVRYNVYEKDNKVIIDPPNRQGVYLIMRDTFLHEGNGKYLIVPETEIIPSIEQLNKAVISKIISNIELNLSQKKKYIKDLTEHRTFLDPPKSTSTKYTFNSTNIPGYVIPSLYTGGASWADPCINDTSGNCR